MICRDYSFRVDLAVAGKRLDVYLASVLHDITRARIKKLIEEKSVLVNGQQSKPSHKVRDKDHIDVRVPPPRVSNIKPEYIAINVLYEDDDIIVVDKMAGMVVHPAAGHGSGTLVNALLAHCNNLSGIGGDMKPGIVHRLDRGTSGVLVVAKNDLAHQSLSRQFKNRDVKKIYNALVYGPVKGEEGIIETSIGRSLKDRKRFSSRTRKGRNALTEWKVVKRYQNDLTFLEIRLRTGRTHQIRVHFTELGHPLVGDIVYGSKRQLHRIQSSQRQKVVAAFARPALHAARLGLTHPVSGKWMEFEAPLPEDFKELLNSL